jgi:hypothetical protein
VQAVRATENGQVKEAPVSDIPSAWKAGCDAEERAVRELGDDIGYGRLMQCAEKVWREVAIAQGTPGSEHTTGPCAAMLVPCEHIDNGRGHCDWCCGSGRVTKRVAEEMNRLKGRT